ncbi:MAG: hypothetical protein QOG83_593 [Alphaproteobacteria bacterium]|jgi:hypothetical protein|nr:hypothetical protein [Alphaproteobacteria bacterium]MEA2987882.1 hypothetical protein [Alphaproteobacteria bacterium]
MRAMTGKAVAAFIAMTLGLAAFGAPGAIAQADGALRNASPSALSAHAQAKSKSARVRARTRIRVTPRCPYRTETLDYPTPYECEYPGPGFVRQCVAQLVQEYRPSGTVIVPVTRCWWERG